MERKTAAVIFGGQSSEHEVSCMSAANVIDRINKEKYDLLLIGITLDGHWIKTESVENLILFSRFFMDFTAKTEPSRVF